MTEVTDSSSTSARTKVAWLPGEDQILRDLAAQPGWTLMEKLPLNHSTEACLWRLGVLHQLDGTGQWLRDEDEILLDQINKPDGASKMVPLPGRTIGDCRLRAVILSQVRNCRMPWRKREDKILLELVATNAKWFLMDELPLNRSVRACRARWKVLRPTSRTQNFRRWSRKEEIQLSNLKQRGLSWVVISQKLGRTPASCQTHYVRLGKLPEGKRVV